MARPGGAAVRLRGGIPAFPLDPAGGLGQVGAMIELGPTYALQAPPRPGDVIEIAPGVQWIRMPLPFALDHVNLWALEDGDGWCLIDTGFPTDEIRALWETVLAGPLGGRPVRRILVTHMHPDHIGLAGWLTERCDAELIATQAEWLAARMLWLDDTAGLLDAYRRFYDRAGLASKMAAALTQRRGAYRDAVSPIPPVFRPIRNGDRLRIGGRAWQVMTGAGHSPDHVCLFAPDLDLLIAGDQVLPRISPNISVWPSAPLADPLGAYLDSLGMFSVLPDDVLVLPSHGLPFRGLAGRVAALAVHHEERLAVAAEACRSPADAMTVTGALFRRKLDQHQITFAIGEALAHLNHLVEQGRVERKLENGRWRYRRL